MIEGEVEECRCCIGCRRGACVRLRLGRRCSCRRDRSESDLSCAQFWLVRLSRKSRRRGALETAQPATCNLEANGSALLYVGAVLTSLLAGV